MFLSEKTSEAFDQLVGAFFDMNRTVDRMCSVMLNKWAMPQAESIIHNKHAHLYPLLADVLSEFKAEYNVSTIYPETHKDDRDYSDIFDMMKTYLDELSEIYEMMKMVYGVATEEGDFNAVVLLHRFMGMLTKVLGQVITLKDKAEQMPNNYNEYDKDIIYWGIDGLDIEKY